MVWPGIEKNDHTIVWLFIGKYHDSYDSCASIGRTERIFSNQVLRDGGLYYEPQNCGIL